MKFQVIVKLKGDSDKQTWPVGPYWDIDPAGCAHGFVDRWNRDEPEPQLVLVGTMSLMNNERRNRVAAKPWTAAETKEIAQLRKKGWEDSRIRGWMKAGNNRKGQCPPLDEKESTMATKKKAKASKKKAPAKKKVSKKKVAKKAPAKKAGRKAAKKAGRKAGEFKVGATLTAVKGLDDTFYKKFPRYKAYQLLCKKSPMKTEAFVNAVEKLDGVKSRGQALGILTKLLTKGCAKAK